MLLCDLDLLCPSRTGRSTSLAPVLIWHAMRRDTLASLEQLLVAYTQFRKYLPCRAHPRLESLEAGIRKKWDPKEAYNMVPEKDR